MLSRISQLHGTVKGAVQKAPTVAWLAQSKQRLTSPSAAAVRSVSSTPASAGDGSSKGPAAASVGTPIRAAVARGPGLPFTVEPLILDDPAPGEVLIRVTACGICHTDLAVRDQHIPSPSPIVLGHEGVGIVERVGDGVSRVKAGDHVLMSYASCGQCINCQSGSPSYCSHHRRVNFGGTRLDDSFTHTSPKDEVVYGAYFRQSAFATHALATERNVVPVPDFVEAPLESLAPLGCGVQTGAGAVMNTLKAGAGSTISVFGVGTVGMSAIMAARVVGSTTIVAVDTSQDRLDVAKEMGATHTFCATPDDDPARIPAELAALTADRGGLDFALDTTGVPAVLRTGFEALRPMGVAALVGGSPPGSELKVDMLSVLLGRTVRGIIQGDSVSSSFLPKLMKLHQQGRFPFDQLITYYDSLDSINTAVADTASGASIKPVIRIA